MVCSTKTMNRNILKYSIHFFCLYFFSLYVSVLFSSCAVSPVSLFLVSDTRVSDMSRPGCHVMPFRISVFSFRLPLFLSARMRIYYNVSLLPDFPPSLKNMFFNTFVNQRFIKMFKRNSKKSPYIFGAYIIKSYFCTRFREREQRCFDILTGTA